MQVVINGEGQDIPEGLTLEELVKHLRLEGGRVAIERNREIVKRELWEQVRVEPNDQLEIVHFVGGG
jgi:thiamine biosynthesis protein ThiS